MTLLPESTAVSTTRGCVDVDVDKTGVSSAHVKALGGRLVWGPPEGKAAALCPPRNRKRDRVS